MRYGLTHIAFLCVPGRSYVRWWKSTVGVNRVNTRKGLLAICL